MESNLSVEQLKEIHQTFLSFVKLNDLYCVEEGDTPDSYDKSGYINLDIPNTEMNNGCILILQKDNKIFFKFYYDTCNYRLDGIDDEYINWLEPYTKEDKLEYIYNQYLLWVSTYEN